MKTTTQKIMADRLAKAAKQYLKKNLKLWEDRSMVSMFKNDYKDLMKISSFIRQNRLALAINATYRMDTAPLDEGMPKSVFNFLQRFDDARN